MESVVDFRSLGRNVRKYREEKGLSAEKLSRISGVSKSHINNIESANAKASLEVMVRIANALEISLDMILCDSLKLSRNIKKMEYALILDDCDDNAVNIIVEVAETLRKKLKEQ